MLKITWKKCVQIFDAVTAADRRAKLVQFQSNSRAIVNTWTARKIEKKKLVWKKSSAA